MLLNTLNDYDWTELQRDIESTFPWPPLGSESIHEPGCADGSMSANNNGIENLLQASFESWIDLSEAGEDIEHAGVARW